MPPSSVEAICTDPPYGLEFMGRDWDRLGGARIRQPSERDRQPGAAHNSTTSLVSRNLPDAYIAGSRMQAWHEAWAREALRVLKPGGHLLAFGGTRTSHRLVCAVEDAGFEIRDCITWLYGSGFPKSLDVSKAIDKAAGAEREVAGVNEDYLRRKPNGMQTPGATAYGYSECQQLTDAKITAPATPEAQQWSGWGTALKPASEPIVVARKPLDGTVAANVLRHGTGALNIDGCRVAGTVPSTIQGQSSRQGEVFGADQRDQRRFEGDPAGRWPANVVLSHSADCQLVGTQETVEAWECVPDCPVRMLDEQTGRLAASSTYVRGTDPRNLVFGAEAGTTHSGYDDPGGASRFFYTAKASSAERNAGLADYARDCKVCACLDLKVQGASPPRDTYEPTEADGFDSSTAGSGNGTTGRSLTASKSTTSTKTRRTTGSGTSSSSPPSSTSESTAPTTDASMVDGSDAAASAANGSHPTPSITTSAQKDGPSTALS
jgi:site-specific DNA-methyltransferase (adenine-specific)